ncbi:MAG TPA: hypothetical protein VML19_17720 [Verrucomicrobiae bacterium]|nr:hypothetical protein [Verrucomicrobiae bacterium]
MRLFHIGLAFILLTTAAFADIITLKSGRVINGTYLGGTDREIKVRIGDQVETFDVSQVVRIEFGAGAAASTSTPNNSGRPTLHRADQAAPPADDPDRPTLRRADGSTASSSSSSDDSGRPTLRRTDSTPTVPTSTSSDDDRPTLRRADGGGYGGDGSYGGDSGSSGAPRQTTILRPGDSQPSAATTAADVAVPDTVVELPAGTNLVVRMIEEVDSEKNTVGQSFKASLMEDVTAPNSNRVVLPHGCDVVVKLVNAKESGKFTGKSELTLSLWSVKLGDRVIDVDTQTVTKQSDSRGTRTATTTGGGAIVGAVIGGIAGGGKGAAIGAAAGAGAGAGVEAVTKGQRVKIPSETRLTFTLDNPVKI